MPVVTYSKNVFLPVTNACRNACRYCAFRKAEPSIMKRRDVLSILEAGRKAGCKEALFTFGERPESDARIRDTLQSWGYSNMTEYLLELCKDAIKLGLLPHTNAGALEVEELKALKEVNASMGLMLESASERLCGPGMPHENSPGKRPDVRLRTIENAGRLKIPFTTGLLIGIGESADEVRKSILEIKELNDRYHHIQEVIVQNFMPKAGTPMENWSGPPNSWMRGAVKLVKEIMPDAHVQVPPNLNPTTWPEFVSLGVDDLGGISPTTKDYINPEAEWPDIRALGSIADKATITLKERLALHPEFIKRGWYSKEIGKLIKMYAGPEGLIR